METLYEIDTIVDHVKGKRGWIQEYVILGLMKRSKKTVLPINYIHNTLHNMEYVGIDTCSAVSVSTEATGRLSLCRLFTGGKVFG
jgi:hypothetical protein